MKKIRAAIVGYGNIGKYVLEALEAAPDFEVAGIIRRNPNDIPDELKAYTVTDSITKLDKVDVAVLATPTRRQTGGFRKLYDVFNRTGLGEFPNFIQHKKYSQP